MTEGLLLLLSVYSESFPPLPLSISSVEYVGVCVRGLRIRRLDDNSC